MSGLPRAPSVFDALLGFAGDGVHQSSSNTYQNAYSPLQAAQQQSMTAQQYMMSAQSQMANRRDPTPPLTPEEQDFIDRIKRKMAILEAQLEDT